MKYLIPLLLVYSNLSWASWFCKEASSKAHGNTFYACGHAQAKSLSEAREQSLYAAKKEFKAFCNESQNCKDSAYTISPLRTDCSKSNGSYSCYRGLEYTILQQKRISVQVDKDDISKRIKEKEKELRELQENLYQSEKLRRLEDKTEQIKKLDSKEAEIEYLKHAKSDYFPAKKKRALLFQFSFIGTPLKKDDTEKANSVGLVGLGTGYEQLLWKNISFRSNVSFVFSGSNESKLKDRGTANTSSETEYHSHKGIDGNLALPITFNKFSFAPTIGYLALNYKSTQYNYNNFGVGLEKTEKSHGYNSGYAGLGVRYGKEWFIEVEPRQYFKDSKSCLSVNLGFKVEF